MLGGGLCDRRFNEKSGKYRLGHNCGMGGEILKRGVQMSFSSHVIHFLNFSTSMLLLKNLSLFLAQQRSQRLGLFPMPEIMALSKEMKMERKKEGEVMLKAGAELVVGRGECGERG